MIYVSIFKKVFSGIRVEENSPKPKGIDFLSHHIDENKPCAIELEFLPGFCPLLDRCSRLCAKEGEQASERASKRARERERERERGSKQASERERERECVREREKKR